ncbi:hypothetical protein [Pseudomonas cremoricolorata]|uniref:hypothetical protein n=1 Tax=Pseudomonas cremoricolorata TaxID=157783 RepID=UPI00067698FC|nr:hypothetical protein [Pseudomonas cremoricolorata]
MALAKDNYIDPESKARWGFGGTAGKIIVGPETVGETGGVDHVRTEPDNPGAHGNGGGAEQVEQLQRANAQLAAEREDLQKQLQSLQQADQERQARDKEEQDRLAAEKEIDELKAKLDAANVSYRANASKESLQKLVDDLPK